MLMSTGHKYLVPNNDLVQFLCVGMRKISQVSLSKL